MSAPAVAGRRVRLRVEGTVQGVGFRPFAYRLASELGLAGWVLNDTRGVLAEVEGDDAAVDAFVARVAAEAPPLATVERVAATPVAATGERGFAIVPSGSAAAPDAPDAPVAPDSATCADCLAELFDPADRRFRYPFVNCTNCGPRFTIICGVPYDRPLTTMTSFIMCAACCAEYEDPLDRRFHAQPNACPACGPQLRLVDTHGTQLARRDDALARAVAALHDGGVVAVKGLGGFHLACLAADEDSVAKLRARKHREDKPFALMVADLEAARALCDLRRDEERLLVSRERPIVLLPRRSDAPVAAAVAPCSPELGVVLPYSPLHHLLLADAGEPLVMTSGNVSDEPIAYEDADGLARLGGIADLFLLHDRPIRTRTDDSVLRAVRGRPLTLRRSRGHVPAALPLGVESSRPLLACGAELKNTFCVAKGARAWVGHHVGDLKNYETLRSFRDGVEHYERLFAVEPEVVAHDLHPDYLSTRYALERDDLEPIGVQHHHAHLAACLAEHGVAGTAVGAIYDGAGLGCDGTVWGGELLVGSLGDFARAGHLNPVRLPGGDRAAREPWRMACAWLVAADAGDPPALPVALAGAVDRGAWNAIARMARSGMGSPVTTSMGRLFDAIAALCGIRTHVNYEGQAAVELEAAAAREPQPRGAYPVPVGADLVLDARETVLAVASDVAAGVPVGVVAARFHAAIAAATCDACARAAAAVSTDRVVLSGGVFQNRLLLEQTSLALERAGLRVLVPERVPPNDGGVAYGQAAVAAARLLERG
jgi:hydrogenase maturation protein HypF